MEKFPETDETRLFASGGSQGGGYAQGGGSKPEDGFMNIPDSVEDLPFGG